MSDPAHTEQQIQSGQCRPHVESPWHFGAMRVSAVRSTSFTALAGERSQPPVGPRSLDAHKRYVGAIAKFKLVVVRLHACGHRIRGWPLRAALSVLCGASAHCTPFAHCAPHAGSFVAAHFVNAPGRITHEIVTVCAPAHYIRRSARRLWPPCSPALQGLCAVHGRAATPGHAPAPGLTVSVCVAASTPCGSGVGRTALWLPRCCAASLTRPPFRSLFTGARVPALRPPRKQTMRRPTRAAAHENSTPPTRKPPLSGRGALSVTKTPTLHIVVLVTNTTGPLQDTLGRKRGARGEI